MNPLYNSTRNAIERRHFRTSAGDDPTAALSRRRSSVRARRRSAASVSAPQHFYSGGTARAVAAQPIHNDIGGDMSNPNLAAGDLIFWMHRANMTAWNVWNAAIRVADRRRATTGERRRSFFDEIRTVVTKTGADVMSTATRRLSL